MDAGNGDALAHDDVYIDGEPLVDIIDDLRLRMSRIESDVEDQKDRRLIGEALKLLQFMLIDLVKMTDVDREAFRARIERLQTIYRLLGQR